MKELKEFFGIVALIIISTFSVAFLYHNFNKILVSGLLVSVIITVFCLKYPIILKTIFKEYLPDLKILIKTYPKVSIIIFCMTAMIIFYVVFATKENYIALITCTFFIILTLGLLLFDVFALCVLGSTSSLALVIILLFSCIFWVVYGGVLIRFFAYTPSPFPKF